MASTSPALSSVQSILSEPLRTVALVSLGCPKNLVDSERMLGLLTSDGLTLTDEASADVIVINTCGFLEASKEESMREILAALDRKRTGRCRRVIVAGCLVQRHKTRLLSEAPGIDRLVGVFDRDHIVRAVRGQENPRTGQVHYLGKYHDLSQALTAGESVAQGTEINRVKQTKTNRLPVFEDDRSRLRLTPRHYAYLRISEGCNQGCTFCTIPSIRGMMRSKPIDAVLAEARELAADGAVELNLIGQDTTSYGGDIGYAPGLSGLLRAMDRELKDVHWLRLMYAYPSCFTDEMIDAIGQCGRVVKYIDMPLQHINDAILKKMRRRVSRAEIEALLEKLRRRIPGLAIRTTFIAGTPGETEAQHRELLEFVKGFGFEMMGVFAYSSEPGTPMHRMEGQLPDAVKRQRVEELMLAQQQVAFARAQAMAGETVEVLIDSPLPGDQRFGFSGRSAAQAPDVDSVIKVRGTDLHPGELIKVKVLGRDGYDLLGEVPRKRSKSLAVVESR